MSWKSRIITAAAFGLCLSLLPHQVGAQSSAAPETPENATLQTDEGAAPIETATDIAADLDALFVELDAARSEDEAEVIQDRIWRAWITYDGPNPAVRILFHRGMMAMTARNARAALQSFTAVISLDPDFAEAWNRRAMVRYLIGDYEGAIDDVFEALAREPRHFGAWTGLGLAYARMGEVDHAVAALESALNINPYLPGTRNVLEELRRVALGQSA